MKTESFINLRDYAVRGLLLADRLYVRVHGHLGIANTFTTDGAYYTDELVSNDLRFNYTMKVDVHPNGIWTTEGFCGDFGLWDSVPGVYHNEWNYVLDVKALLQNGIRINMDRVLPHMLPPDLREANAKMNRNLDMYC